MEIPILEESLISRLWQDRNTVSRGVSPFFCLRELDNAAIEHTAVEWGVSLNDIFISPVSHLLAVTTPLRAWM